MSGNDQIMGLRIGIKRQFLFTAVLLAIAGTSSFVSRAIANHNQGPPVVIADPHPNRTSTTTAEYDPGPAIELDLTARKECKGEPDGPGLTHQVLVQWRMADVETGVKRVAVRALLSDGEILEKEDAGLTGNVKFRVDRPLGSQIIVTVNAEVERGNVSDNNTLVLTPCVDTPRPPAGAGFVALPPDGPVPPPAPIGNYIGESHFVHLGGTGNPNRVLMVSAVGTGVVGKLSSWTLGRAGSEIGAPLKPILLENLDQDLIGYNVKLHTLSPELSPKLVAAPFINGIIRDGKLWITTRQLDNSGGFLELDTRGYGGVVNRDETVIVKEYAMAHRSITVGNTAYFELITPILTEDNTIRVLSWAIRKSDGVIFGLQDSGKLIADPTPVTLLSISRIRNSDNIDYVIVYNNSSGVITSILLDVINGASLAGSGLVFDRGNAASGLNLPGTDIVAEYSFQTVVMPMNRGGYVTASYGSFDRQTSVWDYHFPGFDVVSVPYKIADHTLDMQTGIGIDIGPIPDLTDGSHPRIRDGDIQKVRARLTDDLLEETIGIGGGEIASVFPTGELTSVGIASVTKVMTLLLAVEAINNGNVSLDDIVEISDDAANTGGSSMDLMEGEKQSLANLMYGMMLVSGNDASVAIAEHVAKKVSGGNVVDFVDWMNLRAGDLGMSDTFYNHPGAGGYSTPQDQITLFRFGSNDPIFREFSSQEYYAACGETKNGKPFCRSLQKLSINGYPGLEGSKGGNLGIPAPEKAGVPLCTACLIAKARRANRAMLVGLQQSGNRWRDAGKLWDYGFTKLFTPDQRAPVMQAGPLVRDVAVDAISDAIAVTAVLTTAATELKLCVWNIWADTGALHNTDDECTTHPGFNLPGDPTIYVRPNLVDGVRVSTLSAEGDYLTVYRPNNLSVYLWRIGSRNP